MFLAVVLAFIVPTKTVQVGPTRSYTTLAAGLAVAVDGDTIEIDAGDYPNTGVQVTRSNLRIVGVGGRPHLRYSSAVANGKGVIVVGSPSVQNLVIENLEISGATGSSGNEAGIRFQGKNLSVYSSYLHDNYNGILEGHGDVIGSTVLLQDTEFQHNGRAGSGQEHNIYISRSASVFTMYGCYSHHVRSGHLVKSRALNNTFIANRFVEGAPEGNTAQGSAVIDIPDGGPTFVIGNQLEKGANAENRIGAIWYASENGDNGDFHLWVINNTYVSNTGATSTSFVIAEHAAAVVIKNNIILGRSGNLVNFRDGSAGSLEFANNLVDAAVDQICAASNVTKDIQQLAAITDARLVDRAGYDWHLTAGSPAIDGGIDAGMANGKVLIPARQYRDGVTSERRPTEGALDIGAFEYTVAATPSDPENPTDPTTPGTPPAPNDDDENAGESGVVDSNVSGGCAASGAGIWAVLACGLLCARKSRADDRTILGRRKNSRVAFGSYGTTR